MYSLDNFTPYTNQCTDNKSLLCWSARSGYFFMSYYSYLLAMAENGNFKIAGIER